MVRKTRKQRGAGRRRLGSISNSNNDELSVGPALNLHHPPNLQNRSLNQGNHEQRSLFNVARNYVSSLRKGISSLVVGEPKPRPEPRPEPIKQPTIEEEIEEINKDLAGSGHTLLKLAIGERDIILRSRRNGVLAALTPEQDEIMRYINETGLTIHNLRSCNKALMEGHIPAISMR